MSGSSQALLIKWGYVFVSEFGRDRGSQTHSVIIERAILCFAAAGKRIISILAEGA